MKKALYIMFLSLLLVPIVAKGQEAGGAPAFFEALYDVPVMPGLEELKDQAMLFDKPDGRIASVTAVSETKSQGDVSRFYAETMPALGWKNINKNQYVRKKDLLTIELSTKSPYTVAKFTLSPRP